MTTPLRLPHFLRRAMAILGSFALMLSTSGAALAQSSPAAVPGGGFVDVTEAVGLSYAVRAVEADDDGDTAARLEDGGLALVDIDGDRRPELYVAHGGGEPGRLFSWDGQRFAARAGNGGIEPAAPDRAGYFIDLDDDGAADFLSVHLHGVQAFRNVGGRRFAEMPDPFPPGSVKGDLYSMAAGDYDRDGDLDLFFAQWRKLSDGLNTPFHYLWRNDGKGRFEDVTDIVPIRDLKLPGLTTPLEVSFTPIFSDIDGDNDPDILLAGDFGTGQVLRNDGGRRFVDIRDAIITDENGMGAAVGDYDRDGDMDWFVTSIHDPEGRSGEGPTGNRLYRNRGDGRFQDATDAAGVRAGGWGWGACFADFDNDGHVDLFHTNGYGVTEAGHYGLEEDYVRKYAGFLDDPSRLFMANGDGTFTERSSELGIRHTGQGRGAVCADYDGDGRIDILIANHAAAPTVYRNVLKTDNRWLAIDLEGRHANPFAVGARVTVHTDRGRQVQEVPSRQRLPVAGPDDIAFRSRSRPVGPGCRGQVARPGNPRHPDRDRRDRPPADRPPTGTRRPVAVRCRRRRDRAPSCRRPGRHRSRGGAGDPQLPSLDGRGRPFLRRPQCRPDDRHHARRPGARVPALPAGSPSCR